MATTYFCVFLRPYFDHSKSQTTLNQTSLTHEEAAALKRAVDTALRENGSPDDASDDPKSDLETRYVSFDVRFPNHLMRLLHLSLSSYSIYTFVDNFCISFSLPVCYDALFERETFSKKNR